MAGKNVRKFFYNHNNVESKKWILKNARKIFLDSHECCEQKNGGKKTRNNFLKILTNIARKKMARKRRAKIFYRFSRISRAKKWRVKKRAENFFRYSRMSRAKNGVKKRVKIF